MNDPQRIPITPPALACSCTLARRWILARALELAVASPQEFPQAAPGAIRQAEDEWTAFLEQLAAENAAAVVDLDRIRRTVRETLDAAERLALAIPEGTGAEVIDAGDTYRGGAARLAQLLNL